MPVFAIEKRVIVPFMRALVEQRARRALEETQVREEKQEFPNLTPFAPMLSQCLARVSRGTGGDEESFEASTELGGDEGELEESIEHCQKVGIAPNQLAKALVEPAVLRAVAFGDLSLDTVAGIEATLTVMLSGAFEKFSEI